MSLMTMKEADPTANNGDSVKLSLDELVPDLDDVEIPHLPSMEGSKKRPFNAEFIFLIGLLLSYFIANYHFIALITVLMSGPYGMSLFSAVVITNVNEGVGAVLVIFVSWLADTYVGYSLILLFSAISYAVGLLLWYYIYKRQHNTIAYFIPGLLLIIAGQCGYDIENGNNYEHEHEHEHEHEQERNGDSHQQQGSQSKPSKPGLLAKAWNKLWRLLKSYWIQIIGLIIVIIWENLYTEKEYNFLIPAIMLFVSSIIFLMGKLFFFPFERPQGRRLTLIVHVFLASFKKRNNNDNLQACKYLGDQQLCAIQPQISQQQTDDKNNQTPDFTDQQRCLNVAASHNSEMEIERSRFSTDQQVGPEDTKRFTKCIPILMVFLMYGIMTAVGATFFVEQISKMDQYVGPIGVPVELFAMVPEGIRKVVSCLCQWMISSKQVKASRRFKGTLRMGLGIVLSIPCFAIAAIVEAKRLKAGRDEEEDYSYMSAFWLTPQLVLLGVMDGLALDGIGSFFNHELPTYISESYSTKLAEGLVGIGKLLSIVWFSSWYHATKIIDGHGWFKKSLDQSRVDYYYVVMAAFGLLTFIVFVWVAFKYLSSQFPPVVHAEAIVYAIHLLGREIKRSSSKVVIIETP